MENELTKNQWLQARLQVQHISLGIRQATEYTGIDLNSGIVRAEFLPRQQQRRLKYVVRLLNLSKQYLDNAAK